MNLDRKKREVAGDFATWLRVQIPPRPPQTNPLRFLEFEKWLCGSVRLVIAKGYVKMVRLLGRIGDSVKSGRLKKDV